MVALHFLRRTRSFLSRPSVAWVTGVLGAFAVVAFLLLAALPPVGVETAHRTLAPPAPSARSAPESAWAIHYGHSAPARVRGLPGVSPNPGTTYEVCNFGSIINGTNPPPQPGYCFNFTVNETFCATPPSNGTLADLGLNLTIATSPANGSGPAPLNFTWNLSVNGGGLPPYLVQLAVYDAGMTFVTTNLTGSLPLRQAGIYYVDVMAEDSTCSQTAYAAFTVDAYDPAIGLNPVHITANASSSTVPANVTYTVNMTGIPGNVTVLWTTPGFFSTELPNVTGVAWQEYYLPGSYNATACLEEEDANGTPNGINLGCGTSANVTLGGVSPVATSVSIASSTYPTNLTFTATLLNATGLPNDTELYLIVWSPEPQHLGTWNTSTNGTVNVTVAQGCGRPWTSYVPPNGICQVLAAFSLLDPSRSIDSGSLGFERFSANLTANGSPSLWNPSVSYSYGPLNGTLPFNLTVNLTAANGAPPYSYSTVLYGRTSGATNATQYPTINTTGYGWNGSLLSLGFTFHRTGVYYLAIFVYDQDEAWVGFALPLIILGNVSAAGPLIVTATGGGGPSGGGAPEADVDTSFLAQASGGMGPYSVQWSFGDGTYGSSVPGLPVYHAYAAPGTYVARVTVRDGRGVAVTTVLDPITVGANPNAVRSTGAPSGPAPNLLGEPVLWAGILGVALLALGGLAAREERRRQGEALVAGIEDGADDPSGDPPGTR